MTAPRTLSLIAGLTLVVVAMPRPAHADWQETNFDIVDKGMAFTPMRPSLATGVIYPEDDCDVEPCAVEEPVAVTRIAYINGNGRVTMVTRIGDPGAPWSEPEDIWPFGDFPKLILDRNGGEVITFVDTTPDFATVQIVRRTAPGQGNISAPEYDHFLRGVTTLQNGSITMPAPPVLQYHGFDSSPSAAPRRIHVVYSVNDELWHAYIDDEGFYNLSRSFERNPIGDDVFWEGVEDYDPDDVAGTWPAAAPLWTVDQTSEGPFNYEAMPAVVFDRYGVNFRRMTETNSPLKFWTERVEIGNSHDQRPTIDAVRDGPPHVAWAPPCDNGGAELYFRQSEVREPYYIQQWGPLEATGAEDACAPSLSLGMDRVPYIAYVSPGTGTVRVAVRPAGGTAWEFDTIDKGAEPSMDYNRLTEQQTIAYVDPASGELRVVDGYWY